MTSHPIRFGLQTGQQMVAWKEIADLWRKADDWGYDSLWVYDHFYPIFVPDPTGPCLEGWTLLSALSQQTRRARIGALVNGNGYRNPCLTAKMAATLDHLSGGRLNLGIGSGWFEFEHQSLGFEFKPVPQRLQALDEACRIIKGMFTQEKTTLHGRHYKVTDAVCNPKPLQKPYPPILIGGQGEKVLLKIVARHADMWNSPNLTAKRTGELIDIIRRRGDGALLSRAERARVDDDDDRERDGADHARKSARANDGRRSPGMPRHDRALYQSGRHAFHLHALGPLPDRRSPALRRGCNPAIPPALNRLSA